jgi:nucleotide-binding universal stress UspA family protein
LDVVYNRRNEMENLPKKIVVPLDGSKNALKALDFLEHIYGHEHNLDVSLLYILPSLPPILADGKAMDKETYARSINVEKRLSNKAKGVLREAKNVLVKKGFAEERIESIPIKKEMGIAEHICRWAEGRRVDAVLIARRGHSDLETFFMGRVSNSLLQSCREAPVWIVGGRPDSRKVLVCVDSSENALRAVDHAGFMLSGTDCMVTIFHTMRHLKRSVSKAVLSGIGELQELSRAKAGQEIGPYMAKAQDMLVKAGLTEEQVAIKVVDGSRSPAEDILKEARSDKYGTIVLGRRGISGIKEFVFGSVTKKILSHVAGFSVWIVR